MVVAFEGFPRLLARTALRPGRWFVAQAGVGAMLCFMTAAGEGEEALVLTFRASKVERLDFQSMRLRDLPGAFATVEDDLVFEPGEPERPRLNMPTKRPFLSGSLLRLRNGDLGVGFAEHTGGVLKLISLTSGEVCEGFDLVFDRWSLSLRRGAQTGLVGSFRPPL